jgi:hypothetical protein
MTDPRLPGQPADEPTDEPADELLDDRAELVLDLVDGVVDRDALDERDDGPALTAAVSEHEQVRAAVGAPVEVPALVRERALRAAMAAHAGRSEELSTASRAAPASHPGRRRPSSRTSSWLLPALATAAAVVLFAGVAGIFFSSGRASDTAATSASQGAAPVADSILSQTGGAETAPDVGSGEPTAAQGSVNADSAQLPLVDFGSASDQAQLAASVNDRILGTEKTTAAPAATSPSSYTARSSSGSGCEPAARALQPPLATAPILVAGPVRYQDQEAIVFVFVLPAPEPGRLLVAMGAADCRVLVTTAL